MDTPPAALTCRKRRRVRPVTGFSNRDVTIHSSGPWVPHRRCRRDLFGKSEDFSAGSGLRARLQYREAIGARRQRGRRTPRGAGGATNGYSTPKDMARYLAALLGGGANEHGTMLKPATLASMFAAQYQPPPPIPGMGPAFWRRTAGGHSVVEHQGIMPGFDSQILAAPDDGVGLMASTNGASRAVQWMPVEMSKLLHHLLGVSDDVIRTEVPQRPEIWGDICGWYYLPGPLTDVRLRTIAGAGVEVFVRRGQLVLRFLTPVPALYHGFPLHPADDTDPYVFRMDADRATRVPCAR